VPESAPRPVASAPARARRDRLAIGAFLAALLAAIACTPTLAMVAGILGFLARRRARIAGRPARLATAAISIAVASIAVQWLLWDLSSRWLLPAMQRRMSAAVTAACEGRWRDAVPSQASFSMAEPLPAPDEESTRRFAERLRKARGAIRSVSLVDQEITGSPMAPTVGMALVLDFEGGSATGSARVQWLPAATDTEAQWLPTVRLLELEVSLPGGDSLTLAADAAAEPAEHPATTSAP